MNAAPDMTRADVHWSKHGCVTLSGELLEWSLHFDAFLAGRAVQLGSAEYSFPSLIAAESLAPIGYLHSFPHLASFVTTGRQDALQALADDSAMASELPACEEHFESFRHLLTPAACYHFYPMFAGSRIAAPLHLTTRCQCFRREDHYEPLQRQWSFDMREIVCIGDAAAIDAHIRAWREEIARLQEHLGITASWQAATDPFYDPLGDPKALAQLVEPSKQELCTPNGLAIASINRHRRFFGESYDIRYGDAHAESACVAFGIERWLHAMTEVHGHDAARWPCPEASR